MPIRFKDGSQAEDDVCIGDLTPAQFTELYRRSQQPIYDLIEQFVATTQKDATTVQESVLKAVTELTAQMPTTPAADPIDAFLHALTPPPTPATEPGSNPFLGILSSTFSWG